MKYLISAIQFLTILPVGKPGTFEPKKMVSYFPMVGLIIGLLLCLFDLVVMKFWPQPVAAVLDVIFLVVITGALHLDGLADTADGLYGNKPSEKALSIMKDSRVGAMGLVVVVCGLAAKWGGISELDSSRALCLFIIPCYARAGTLFGLKFLSYGRPEGGTGHAFFETPLGIGDFWGLLIPVILSLFLGFNGLLLNLVFLFTLFLILRFYKNRIGCITGDMLGAMIEILESVLFIVCAMS
ncbi:MAG: adenosylcobinamide-GDP ribazoletransferase [Desulfobacterales bacterium]|nr:adenosylcobinamide-GDP ribazoletransferase [Desulfobacterales bacterium]